MDYTLIVIYIASMVALAIFLNIGGWFFTIRIFDKIGTRLKFYQFVGIRHLKGRKSSSLTAIGLLSIIGVSFSSCTVTTVLSVMGGFSDDLKQKILSANAHIVVDNFAAPLAGIPDDEKITTWNALLDHLNSRKDIIAATPIVQGEVMINAKTNNNGMLLRGVDTKTIGSVSDILEELEQGKIEYITKPDLLFKKTSIKRASPLDAIDTVVLKENKKSAAKNADNIVDSDDSEEKEEKESFIPAPVRPEDRVLPGIIVGREMARALRLYLGEEVKIISPFGDIGPTGPIPKSRPFRIAGTFFSGMYAFDEHYGYTTIEAAQRFLGKENTISEIHISISSPDTAVETAKLIQESLGSQLRVRSWQEMNSELFSALKLEKIVMFILLSIAILVASFSIIATLTMLVLEKGPEISVLMTVGASKTDINNIFRFEGFLIGAIGTVTGLFVGYFLCFTLVHIGLPIPPDVWYIDKLPVDIDLKEFAAVGITSLIVTVLATVYPTKVASSITPVEGLKE